MRNSIVGKRWKYTMAIWKGKPKNANKIVMHHMFVFWIWGDSFLFKTVVRCYLRLLFQTGTFYMYLCQVVCCFGRMKTYFIAIKCNLNVCMCAMWWWWLRIINVGTKATNTSVPSDLSHFTTLSLSQLFSILSLSVPFQSPLCMIPYHFGHCFQFFFYFVMLLMRNSCAFLRPSKWNTRIKKINSFYGSLKQWNFHPSKHQP